MSKLRIIAGCTYKGEYNRERGYLKGQFVTNAAKTAMYVSLRGTEEERNTDHPLDDSAWWEKCLTLEVLVATLVRLQSEMDAAETLREQAEGRRSSAETLRANAELRRANNEVDRDTEEGKRAQAETRREQAETRREQDETQRATDFANILALFNELAAHPSKLGEDLYQYVYDIATHQYNKTDVNAGTILRFDHTYSSVAELEAETREIPDGRLAIIDTGNVEDPDNARLYTRRNGEWRFLTDLSGLQGIAGKTPQIAIGTITSGDSKSAAHASLSPDGVDNLGNPKFNLNFVVPCLSYSDLTPEQIADLQRPATDMIDSVNEAIERYEDAETQRETSFETAQTQRATAFNTSQTERQTAFETAMSEMQTAFETAEAQRQQDLSEIEGRVETAESNIEALQAFADRIGSIVESNKVWAFFVKIHGDGDPAACSFYGEQENVHAIMEHSKMGWFRTREDYDVCAPGRISQDIYGNDIPIDGSKGDLCHFFDTDMHWYGNKVNDPTLGNVDVYGIGLYPITLFGKDSMVIPACGQFADRAVVVGGKNRCFYNPSVNGTGGAGNGLFKESYNPTGAGRSTQNQTCLTSIVQSQAKNRDGEFSDGWYADYYVVYELWLRMMMVELGTTDHSNITTGLGTGTTVQDPAATDEQFYSSSAIYGNSGMRALLSDGTVKGRVNLYNNSFKTSAAGSAVYNAAGLCSGNIYVMNEMIEPQRVLDGISKNGWTGHVGDATKIYTWNGAELVLASGVNLLTGEGMTANKAYYVCRNVAGCRGIADGVFTAVVNKYVKMSFADAAVYSDNTPLAGGCAIFKFSMPVYCGRAFNVGSFVHLFGAHYVYHTAEDNSHYVTYIYQPDYKKLHKLANAVATYYGDEDAELPFEEDMLKDDTHLSVSGGWAGACNPAISMFYFPNVSGAAHRNENAYVWKDSSWGCKNGGGQYPDPGKKSVNACVSGCSVSNGNASARTVSCDAAVSCSITYCASASALIGIVVPKRN